ncbi:hypothetical protein EPA93_19135 [Ktedonosporobacter rubrisoli]|uniref:Uncharacterized protein n=1 Tax=Ktedonosporobacter rubrisoli TaxID=2509675 RepID=A0A4P6JRL9_KTERU|nr:hypothetical protein [Ktedonosporobacter rubrisoli]QBD77994.1 hypothetical protein EPA93_19135 [Ktedonosporobacter rubrisoli]
MASYDIVIGNKAEGWELLKTLSDKLDALDEADSVYEDYYQSGWDDIEVKVVELSTKKKIKHIRPRK